MVPTEEQEPVNPMTPMRFPMAAMCPARATIKMNRTATEVVVNVSMHHVIGWGIGYECIVNISLVYTFYCIVVLYCWFSFW